MPDPAGPDGLWVARRVAGISRVVWVASRVQLCAVAWSVPGWFQTGLWHAACTFVPEVPVHIWSSVGLSVSG